MKHNLCFKNFQFGGAGFVTNTNNQKRARTRITDEQLKILRAHFDINNSPSEESIIEMSKMADLPTKVVKHWFRNTLFKERQRNKDSPYNFSNPPSTTLNLEEYERTGNAKVANIEVNVANNKRNIEANYDLKESYQRPSEGNGEKEINMIPTNAPSCISNNNNDQKYKNDSTHKIKEELSDVDKQNIFAMAAVLNVALTNSSKTKLEPSLNKPNNLLYNIGDCKSECESINSSISEQLNSFENESQPQSPTDRSWLQSNTPSPSSQQQTEIGNTKKNKENSIMMNSNSSNGKRANRTRFSDYQIKVLQEFFENNSYPKDSDLEYLSKLLLLSPRVIVVWFQVCHSSFFCIILLLMNPFKNTNSHLRMPGRSKEKYMKISQTQFLFLQG